MRTKRTFGLIGVLLFAGFQLIGCAPKQPQGATPVGQLRERAEVPFQVLVRDKEMTAWQPYNLLKREVYVPVINETKLSTFLNINSLDSETEPYPPKEIKLINFDSEIGFYLTRGLKSSGGYSLRVTRIEKEGQTVYVHLNLQDPKGMVDAAMHYKVTLLKINRADLPKGDVKMIVTDQNGKSLQTWDIIN
ncbi:MAG: protease complex subunit PrcB family protein [Tumebacillaceae bacterium]